MPSLNIECVQSSIPAEYFSLMNGTGVSYFLQTQTETESIFSQLQTSIFFVQIHLCKAY